jgi:DNA-binding CsgD family transcriptional regulator
MSDGAQAAGLPRPANRLLERDGELAAIDALMRDARTGDSRLLIVEGPAGIGKSRLVAETRRRATAAGIRVRSSRGSELERDFPFGVVRQLFEADVLDAGGETLLGGAAAAARPIFTSIPGSQGEADASFAALHGLYWLTVNLAGEEPLVLVVDDLHWCDRPSLRFLAYLVRRLEGLPISVVTSLRPAEPGVDAALIAELTTDPLAVSLHPMALSAAASGELIGARLGTEPAQAFADLCHSATGGNPLLLSELLKAMEAEGVQPDAAHADVVQEIGPRAASRAVLVRLSRLPGQVVDVARSLAVLGEGADLGAVAALAGLDRAAAAEAIGELTRVEIVRSDPPLGFVHPLVRAAVYTDLPAARREECHARAARILADAGVSACEVAAQLIPTPGRGDQWVVETLEAAARTALGQGAPDSAAAYLNRALAEPPPPVRRAEFLLRVGSTESMIDGPASLEHLRAAYETASDPLQRAQAAAALAPIMFFLGMTAEGAAVAERGMAELGPDDGDLRLQLEATRLIQALWDPESMARNDPVFTRYRTESLGDGPGARLLSGATAYHWAMTGGPAEECTRLARHAVGDGVLVRVANGAIPYVGAQLVLLNADAPDGLDAVNEAFRAAHESGALFSAIPTRLFRGLGLAMRGELAEAEQLERAAMHDNDVWGFVSVRLFPGSLLARVLVERGDLAGAAEALAHANPDNSAMQEITNSVFWISSRLRLLVASGAPQDALEVADDCRERFDRMVANPAWLPWRSLAAQALARLDRRDEAVELAEEELVLARSWGAPGTVGRALRVLGTVLREEGLPYLEEAVAVTEGTPARLEHAKALAALGTGLRLARRPTEARDPLRRALEMATVFDAAVLAEHARTELQATGARPRTEALSGVAALTASEQRVARAAAEGQSNKDIAQALYVTPKTIEVHLSNAYRKLGIRSRRELQAALAG